MELRRTTTTTTTMSQRHSSTNVNNKHGRQCRTDFRSPIVRVRIQDNIDPELRITRSLSTDFLWRAILWSVVTWSPRRFGRQTRCRHRTVGALRERLRSRAGRPTFRPLGQGRSSCTRSKFGCISWERLRGRTITRVV